MKRRDLVKKLRAAGYKPVRNGKHEIFQKGGFRSVQVPNHKELNEQTARAILEAAGVST